MAAPGKLECAWRPALLVPGAQHCRIGPIGSPSDWIGNVKITYRRRQPRHHGDHDGRASAGAAKHPITMAIIGGCRQGASPRVHHRRAANRRMQRQLE